jgi:hypothetical protein
VLTAGKCVRPKHVYCTGRKYTPKHSAATIWHEIGRSAHEYDSPAVGAEKSSGRRAIAAVGPCRAHTYQGGSSRFCRSRTKAS